MQVPINTDGLFSYPYTDHDWIILVLAFAGYVYRMYLWYNTQDVKNPVFKDWIGMFFLVSIFTIGLYELAIHKKWEMKIFFLPFAISIVLAKDLTDWLFLSKEGKRFVINTFKEMISGMIEKLGYIKQKKSDNE